MTERGSITVWLLGLCVCLLFLGGLSVDLWRVMNERRELVSLADAAAIEGAGAIDEDMFRRTGRVWLHPARARRQATSYLSARIPPRTDWRVVVRRSDVRVHLERRVRLSLLGVLLPDEHLTVRAVALVEPRRRT